MFEMSQGAWDKVAEQKAKVKYRDELGFKMVQQKVFGLDLEVLRYGQVIYHMGADAGFKPSYRYFFTELELAQALQCTQNRVHQAVTRLKLDKPKVILKDDDYVPSYRNLIYQSSFYMELKYLEDLLEDLAQRRPYLNIARTAYKTYLDSGRYNRNLRYFGRQGITK